MTPSELCPRMMLGRVGREAPLALDPRSNVLVDRHLGCESNPHSCLSGNLPKQVQVC